MTARRFRRVLYLFVAIGVTLVGLGVAAWLLGRAYAPALARERVEAALASGLERPVRLGQVLLRPWRGRVELVGVAVAAGPTWDAGTMLELGRAEVTVGISSLWRRELVLSRVLLQDLDLSVTGSGPAGPAVPLLLPARIQVGPLRTQIRVVEIRQGRVTVRDPGARREVQVADLHATVRPREDGMDVAVRSAALRIQTPGVREVLEDLEAEARVLPERISIRGLAVRWEGRTLQATGEIRSPWSGPALALEVRAEVPLAPLAGRAGLPWAVGGIARVEAALAGPLGSPRVSGEFAIAELTAGPVRVHAVAVRGSWKDGTLRLAAVGARAFQGDLRGSLTLRPGRPSGTLLVLQLRSASLAALGTLAGTPVPLSGTLDAEAEFRGSPGRPGGMRGHIRLTGTDLAFPGTRFRIGAATVSVEAAGRWDRPEVAGRLRIPALALDGTRVDGVEVPFRLLGRTLHFDEAVGTVGQSRVMASGKVTWRNRGRDLRFAVALRAPAARIEDLAAWIPAAWRGTGQFTLTGRLEGSGTAWQGSGTVEATSLAWPHAPVRDLQASIAVNPDRLEVKRLRARVHGLPIHVEGAWRWAGGGWAGGVVGPLPLAEVPGLPPHLSLDGRARGTFRATLRGSAGAASGIVEMEGVSLAGLPLGPGRLRVAVEGHDASAEVAFPEAGLSGVARGRLEEAGVITARVKVQDLVLGPVLRYLVPEGAGQVEGIVSARAVLRVPVRQPAAVRGEVHLEPVRLMIAGESWENRGPIRVRREAGGVRLEGLYLAGRAGTLTGSGGLDDDGTLAARVRGQVPLAFLPAIRPEIQEAEGILEVSAQVAGTLGAPVLSGEGRVAGGRFLLRDFPETIREVQARFRLSPRGLQLSEAVGGVGGGRVRASGDVTLAGRQLGTYRITLTLRNVPAPLGEGFTNAWDADLELVGSGGRAQLRGEVRLVRGTYTRELALGSLLQGSAAGPAAPAAPGLPLRVLVKLEDNLVARTRLVRLRGGGTVSLEGTTAAPVLFGTLEAREGQITFRKHRFTLVSASARFADPRRIDPFLDVVGTARIQNHDVTVHLSGRMDDMAVRLSSVPPLPQEDLLALITFGVTREALGRSPMRILAREAAQVLVQDLWGITPRGVGLEGFEVKFAGEAQETVQIGKTLMGQTLLIYSQNLTDARERTFRVEHPLAGPLLLTGEQDFQGGYGTDLLLRLRFR